MPTLLMVGDSNLDAEKQLADAYWKSNRALNLIYSGEGECPDGFEDYVSLSEFKPVDDAGRASVAVGGAAHRA